VKKERQTSGLFQGVSPVDLDKGEGPAPTLENLFNHRCFFFNGPNAAIPLVEGMAHFV